MSQKCQAANCNSKLKNGVKFFNFPSDPERKILWIKVCDRDPDWFPTSRNQKLCQIHFHDDQFENRRVDGLRKLKWNAVPTIKTSMLTRYERDADETATVKLEDPTYGIKTEPLYVGYEERLMTSLAPESPDEMINETKPSCQICNRPLDSYPNNLCKVCEKKFEFDHEQNIQKKKNRMMVIRYQCDECLKAFSNVNTYQRHIKCHDGKKPYRCKQCQKRFYHSKDLVEHMEIHETSINISTPTATLCSVHTHLLSNQDFATSELSELKGDTNITVKSEKIDDEFKTFNVMDHNVEQIKVEPSKGPITVQVVEQESKMFENPYNPLPMVQIENFELFGNYQKRENETVENDVFYDESPSSNTTTSYAEDADQYQSIVKVESETFDSIREYDTPSVNVDHSTDNVESLELEYVKEIKGDISESTNDPNQSERECYVCKHCHKDFMYFGNYAKHLEQHSIGKLMCKFCNQCFGSTYQIRKHIRDYHSINQENFSCSVCFIALPKHYFASHMRTHRSDDKTLICKYCGCRFSEPSELFYHFKNKHSDSVESNATAVSRNTEESVSIQPIEEVTGTEKYKCKYCGLNFDDVIKMYHHVKVHVKHTNTTKRMVSTKGRSN